MGQILVDHDALLWMVKEVGKMASFPFTCSEELGTCGVCDGCKDRTYYKLINEALHNPCLLQEILDDLQKG